jgi:hypothetical protein
MESSLDPRWDVWIRDSISPVPGNTGNEHVNLDHRLGALVIGDGEHLDIPGLTSAQRFWVHTRASQLELVSATNHDSNLLRVSKPAGWSMDWTPSKTRRLSKKTKKRTACDECGDSLDACQALYNWRGFGPLCEQCVNGDPELEGMKWETLDY